MLALSEMQGLWSRSLLVGADGKRDTTTLVWWLQGPTLFADLRQPADRPSFGGVRHLGDLTGEQLAWLAEQEGFAGRLEKDGEYFVWRRLLDFQPPSPTPDSGRLWLEGETMIEEGRYSPYIEHWHRDDEVTSPSAAARLRDSISGAEGFLVRVGTTFMYARGGSSGSRPAGTRLSEGLDKAASLEAARELVDCEISIGSVEGGAWTIARSSLPYREGENLDPHFGPAEDGCTTADVAADGSAMRRTWRVMELEGEGAALGDIAAFEAEFATHG